MKDAPRERLRQALQEDKALRHEVDFETAQMGFLLTLFRASKRVKSRLLEAEQAMGGMTLYTFRALNSVYSSFPLFLRSTTLNGVSLHLSPKAQFPAWHNRFLDLPFVSPYVDFAQEVGEDSCGRVATLTFKRKGMRHGMAMHGTGLEKLWFGTYGFNGYIGGDRDNPIPLFVRGFQALLEAVYNKGHGWHFGE